jgi:hypothetical protein
LRTFQSHGEDFPGLSSEAARSVAIDFPAVFAYVAAQLPALLRAELPRTRRFAGAAFFLARIAASPLARIATLWSFALRLVLAFLLKTTQTFAI